MYNTYSVISVLNTFQAAIVLRRIQYLRTSLYEMYAILLNPKMYLRTKFGIPNSNNIQICSGLDLSRTEARGQGHSDSETVGDTQQPKMYPHIQSILDCYIK